MTDTLRTPGIHHVTAIASDPTENHAFYTETLGLRLVKRSVNQDDIGVYHLFYADESGSPGTSMTFFPYAGARSGRVGTGQVTTVSFLIPDDAVDYWTERLTDRAIDVDRFERFGDEVVAFEDPDGLPLELVARDDAPAGDPPTGPVPADRAIRGFVAVELAIADPGPTVGLLEAMGYRETDGDDAHRRRFETSGGIGFVVDVVSDPGASRGTPGAGTVHHVAYRVTSDEQASWRELLPDHGFDRRKSSTGRGSGRCTRAPTAECSSSSRRTSRDTTSTNRSTRSASDSSSRSGSSPVARRSSRPCRPLRSPPANSPGASLLVAVVLLGRRDDLGRYPGDGRPRGNVRDDEGVGGDASTLPDSHARKHDGPRTDHRPLLDNDVPESVLLVEKLVTQHGGIVPDDGVVADRDPVRPEHVRGRLESPRHSRPDRYADPTQEPVFQSEAGADPHQHDHDVVSHDSERRFRVRPRPQRVPRSGGRMPFEPRTTRIRPAVFDVRGTRLRRLRPSVGAVPLRRLPPSVGGAIVAHGPPFTRRSDKRSSSERRSGRDPLYRMPGPTVPMR